METAHQLSERNLTADYFYLPWGSGATFNGVFAAKKPSGLPTEVGGVVRGSKREGRREALAKRAPEAAKLLALPVEASTDKLVLLEGSDGDKRWSPSKEGNQVIRLGARTEGVFLDPVYSSKARATLIDQIRQGRIGQNKTVMLLHTGSIPHAVRLRQGSNG